MRKREADFLYSFPLPHNDIAGMQRVTSIDCMIWYRALTSGHPVAPLACILAAPLERDMSELSSGRLKKSRHEFSCALDPLILPFVAVLTAFLSYTRISSKPPDLSDKKWKLNFTQRDGALNMPKRRDTILKSRTWIEIFSSSNTEMIEKVAKNIRTGTDSLTRHKYSKSEFHAPQICIILPGWSWT